MVMLACVMVVGAGCSRQSVEAFAPYGTPRGAVADQVFSLLDKIAARVHTALSFSKSDEFEEPYEGQEDEEYNEGPEEVAPARAVERLYPSNVNASSVAPSSKNVNDAGNAVDGNPQTWWGEGASGDGIGEWFEYSWSGRVEIREIRLIGGYQKDIQDTVGDRWPLNNRLRRVTVIIPGATSFDAYLDDRKGFQTISVPPGSFGTSVRVVIMDVYRGYNAAGKHIEDSGISEIEVFGVR